MKDPVVRLVYFIILIPFHWLSFHWLWNLICESAGLSRRQVWEYRAKVRHQPRPQKYIPGYIISKSPDQKRTKRLLFFYWFGSVPLPACIAFAVVGLYSSGLNWILGYAEMIVPCIIAIGAVAGIWHHAYRKKQGTLPEKRESIADGIRYWLVMLHREEVAPYKKANGGNLAKTILISTGKLAIAIGLLVGIFLLIMHLTNHPKMPATAEQVSGVLAAQSYAAQDTTALYCEAWDADGMILEAVSARQGDVSFSFFVLDSDASALRLEHELYAYILREKGYRSGGRFEERMSNYSIFTIKRDGSYSALVRVGGTLVYAYSDVENAAKVEGILSALGYF